MGFGFDLRLLLGVTSVCLHWLRGGGKLHMGGGGGVIGGQLVVVLLSI